MIIVLITGCEKNYYEADPRLYNDAMHGNIIGKVLQTSSNAKVTVSQIKTVSTGNINATDGSFIINNLPIGNYDLTIEADDYRIYQLCNVKVEGAGNTYVGEVDLSTVPDPITSHYPEDKAEIVYNNRYSRLTISILFNQPMDRESVEKAFSTIPASDGVFHWGQYSEAVNRLYYSEDALDWGFDAGATITTYSKITSLSFQMSQKDCFTDTIYKVILSTEAKDTAGNHLRFPLEFTFSTVQSSTTQNAILTSPIHGDIYVTPVLSSGIKVTFPRRMDAASTESNLTITPASNNIYIWPEKNILTIYTGGVLRADTSYNITIGADAEDLDGVKLGNPFSFSFSTAPVSVSSTSPRNGELFVSQTDDININFNTYMSKSSVQNAFSITPEISGTLDWYYSSKTNLVFNPNTSFTPNTKYTVTIGTQAQDIFGSHLDEPYTFSFIVRPE